MTTPDNRALWELVDAKFRSGNSIPVERIVITRAEYEAVINRPVAENTDEVVCEVMAIVRNMDREPSLEFTGEGDLYEIPDGTPVWLLSGGNFDTPDDGWMSLYTKPQTAILELPVVAWDSPKTRCPTCDGPCDMFEEEGTFEVVYVYRSTAK